MQAVRAAITDKYIVSSYIAYLIMVIAAWFIIC